MLWSPDSALLAVHYQSMLDDEVPSQRIEIWLRSNWRWYLKQTLSIEGSTKATLLWNEEGPTALTICNEEGEVRKVGVCS